MDKLKLKNIFIVASVFFFVACAGTEDNAESLANNENNQVQTGANVVPDIKDEVTSHDIVSHDIYFNFGKNKIGTHPSLKFHGANNAGHEVSQFVAERVVAIDGYGEIITTANFIADQGHEIHHIHLKIDQPNPGSKDPANQISFRLVRGAYDPTTKQIVNTGVLFVGEVYVFNSQSGTQTTGLDLNNKLEDTTIEINLKSQATLEPGTTSATAIRLKSISGVLDEHYPLNLVDELMPYQVFPNTLEIVAQNNFITFDQEESGGDLSTALHFDLGDAESGTSRLLFIAHDSSMRINQHPDQYSITSDALEITSVHSSAIGNTAYYNLLLEQSKECPTWNNIRASSLLYSISSDTGLEVQNESNCSSSPDDNTLLSDIN